MSADHWLDRLAVAHTRRQGFKALLAGTAMSLPLLRSLPAWAAEDTHACRKGCLYSSHRQFRAENDACGSILNGGWQGYAEAMWGINIFGLVKAAEGGAMGIHCVNRALLDQKYRNDDCTYANCPGFDPAGEYGPCRNCASIPGCQCCPDSSSSTGYTYCSSLSGRCCAPGGGCRNCTES